MLYLAQEVTLAIYPPACLPPANDNTAFDGKMALAVGIFFIFFFKSEIRSEVQVSCLYALSLWHKGGFDGSIYYSIVY